MKTPASSDFANRLAGILSRQRAAFVADGIPTAAVRIDRLDRAAAMLVANKDAIARALSADFGHRSREETLIADIFAAVTSLRTASANVENWMLAEQYPALAPDARARVEHVPLGVVGIIGPWNFPYNLVFSPLAGVLAAGNRAIIKPSEFTPEASALMAKIVAETFSPDEVTVTLGGPAEGADFAAARFDHLIFTRSEAVAKHVMRAAAENLTPVTLELGGKSPVIVTGEFDLAEAAARVMTVKTYNAGQICLAPDYVFVPAGLEQQFAAACQSAMRTMHPDGLSSVDYSSILTEPHFQRLIDMVEDARDKGGEVIELMTPDPASKSRRLAPTLILNATDEMVAMKEEVFGPVLPVVSYDSIDQVLSRIRSGPRPLALYYFGADNELAREVLDGTLSGGVTINDVMAHVFCEDLPFGGIGASGVGSYHGRAGFLTFSHARSIYLQSNAQSAAMLLRAPYGPDLNAFLEEALAG